MKHRMLLFAMLLAGTVLSQIAQADSAAQRALAFAEALRNESAGSVAAALDRVAAEESALRIAQAAAGYAKRAKDREAMEVAAQAVSEAEQGLREAEQLLQRARAFLAECGHTVEQMREWTQAQGKPGALVVPIEGDVRRVDSYGNVGASLSGAVLAGDRVETGPNSKAQLFVAGGDSEIELAKNSSFTILQDEDTSFEGFLIRGIAHLRARTKKFQKKFEVRTPTGVIAVRGTGFTIEVIPDGTLVKVFEGTVSVTPTSGGDPVEVLAGTQRRYIIGQGFMPAEPLEDAEKQYPWSVDAPVR